MLQEANFEDIGPENDLANFLSVHITNADSVKVKTTEPQQAWRHSPVIPILHDDAIEWKDFPRYWPFVWEIHRLPVHSTHKGQWRGALMFSLICAWINGWVNNR